MNQFTNNSIPVVSVCMITFNQQHFIQEAIESILNQKTDYSFELIIGEDYSTDNTRIICEDYKNKFPEKIILLDSDKNYGIGPNFYRTLSACKGKYIAICEGDDYWHDEKKLQKQIDFMENNQDYILTTTDFRVYIEHNKEIIAQINKDLHYDYSFKSMLNGNLTASNTLIFRNKFKIPKELSNCTVADWPLKLYLLQFGKGYHLNSIMSTYRIHGNGIWNGSVADLRDDLTIVALLNIKSIFQKEFRQKIGFLIKKLMYIYSVLYINSQKKKCRKYFRTIVFSIPLNLLSLKAFLRLVKTYF
jgi:glycosyltransferase involved in cell wall biosynthesis